ncbi:helix-turn-helix domain-containing protein [Bacillus chungangensis]|uniref:XRE family transcriptional regulator of biofilm formation n=1 Tax=Bacillus chungangensis TaxID=587633 RepID=A0ABT9WPG4_9BACI|nr:helix-turn-helix transcriptional regulator [Bacillus chungangensis]MDQ0175066.1 XRE family transcriptional regulator of biofilm formation [Bacillus chungangensis]
MLIGKRIKAMRKKKGLSITKLAKQAGVSKSYLSYIERNIQNNPSMQFLGKIAVPLDTTIEYLLDETKTENKLAEIEKEWEAIVHRLIDAGISKEDFLEFQDFIKFKNWQKKGSTLK